MNLFFREKFKISLKVTVRTAESQEVEMITSGVYCVMRSQKSGATLWNVLRNENAVQCFYMLTDIKGCE